MIAPHPLIAAALAAPKTHRVITTYRDGRVRFFDTRSEASAENHSVRDRRNIGRELIVRETGAKVMIVAVAVQPIPTREQLAADYKATVGYDPFEDCPEISEFEVAHTLAEIKTALALGIEI